MLSTANVAVSWSVLISRLSALIFSDYFEPRAVFSVYLTFLDRDRYGKRFSLGTSSLPWAFVELGCMPMLAIFLIGY